MLDDVFVSPSILSADLGQLASELESVASADFIHVDVMDGHFVPNVSWGPIVVEAVTRATDVPADVHLMVSNPDDTIGLYLNTGARYVTFHAEAARHAHRLIGAIHEAGVKAGVAINPGTPVSVLEPLIEELDLILVMSVNPGYGGQKFIGSTLRRLRQVRALCEEFGVSPLIEVDGGVGATNAAQIVEAGANLLVAGSAVFGASDRAAAIEAIRVAGREGATRRA